MRHGQHVCAKTVGTVLTWEWRRLAYQVGARRAMDARKMRDAAHRRTEADVLPGQGSSVHEWCLPVG